MSLNAKAIETLSVNAVKDSITMSDFLEPFIADNDKEPSWDGAIYIYGCKDHKKENLKGRLSVQVKGKECNDFSHNEISYPMSIIDLKNYLYDGGVILFVVYIGGGGITRKIYYIELPPIKLRLTLATVKDQKTKTLVLKQFPTDNNKKDTILLNCLENCQRQASFTNAKLFSLDELEKQGILEGITIPLTAVGVKDPQRALVTNEVYMYANIKGSSIPQPLEFIPEHLITNQEQNSIITIEDNVYYTKIQEIKTMENTTYKIGESFTISFVDVDKPCKMVYKNSTKVRILARDLDFMLSYIEFGYFKINGTIFKFDRDVADFSHFDMKEQKYCLKFAKRAVEALDMLNCKKDLDLNELSVEDRRNLEILITAFVEKQPVANLKSNLPPLMKLRVGKLYFAVCFQTFEGIKNTYNIYDFFKTEMAVAYDGKDGEKLPTSQYCILHADDFLRINNIRFDVLLPSFQKVEKHYDIYNIANYFLLDLLTAFDNSNGERTEILKTAHEFATWIFHSANDDELPYHLRILNYLQVIKRERSYNDSELAELFALIESSSAGEEILVGAYLLLDQQKAAEIHFDKLAFNVQESFKSYPIYHFCMNKEDDDKR